MAAGGDPRAESPPYCDRRRRHPSTAASVPPRFFSWPPFFSLPRLSRGARKQSRVCNPPKPPGRLPSVLGV